MATFEKCDRYGDKALRFVDAEQDTYYVRDNGGLWLESPESTSLMSLDSDLATKLAALLAFYAAHGTIEGFREDAGTETPQEATEEPLPPGWRKDDGVLHDAWENSRGDRVWTSFSAEGQYCSTVRGFLQYFPDRDSAMRGEVAEAEPALPPGWTYDEHGWIGPNGAHVAKSIDHAGQFYRWDRVGGDQWFPTLAEALAGKAAPDDDEPVPIPDDQPNLEGRIEALNDHYDALQAAFAALKAEQAVTNHKILTAMDEASSAMRRLENRLRHRTIEIDNVATRADDLESRVEALERRERQHVAGFRRPTLDIGEILRNALDDTDAELATRRDVP